MLSGIAALIGANPALAANPLLAAANPLLAQSLLGNLLAASGMSRHDNLDTMDPDVLELCEYFDIEERHRRNLNELMKARQKTFSEDMKRLWDVLERANSPCGLLVVKMREMEEGTFVGKAKVDPRLLAISKKYKLDDQAESKLADTLARHDDQKRSDYMFDLEKHLEVSDRPSARAMMLLRKIGEGQPLGRPGPPAPGSYLDSQSKEKESKDKDKDRDRDRDRRQRSSPDRGRERDRDRRDDDRDRRDRDRKDDRDKRSRSRDKKDDRDKRSRSRRRD